MALGLLKYFVYAFWRGIVLYSSPLMADSCFSACGPLAGFVLLLSVKHTPSEQISSVSRQFVSRLIRPT